MATYRVQGPDGAVHEFSGPDNASEADVLAAAQAQFGAPQPPAPDAPPAAPEQRGGVGSAIDAMHAFQGGVARGATFDLAPNVPEAQQHPYAAGAGELLGGAVSGGAELKGIEAAGHLLAPGATAAVKDYFTLKGGQAFRNLLRLVAGGAAGGAVTGGTVGAVDAAATSNDVASGAATGAATGAIGGGMIGPVAAGGVKVGGKILDAAQSASVRGLQLLADKLEMPVAQLRTMMSDFKAATGRNATLADIVDAKTKANMAPTIAAHQASHVTMQEAAEAQPQELPGRVIDQLNQGTTQTARGPLSETTLGELQNDRDAAFTPGMDQIRHTPITVIGPDAAKVETALRAVAGKQAPVDVREVSTNLQKGYITLNDLDILRRSMADLNDKVPGGRFGNLSADLGAIGRTQSPEYDDLLRSFTSNSRFINGFKHGASAGKDPTLSQDALNDVKTPEGMMGRELGARTRLIEQAQTESGAANVVNQLRQPNIKTGLDPNEQARLGDFATAEIKSQQNYGDLGGGTVKSKEQEQGAALQRVVEGAAATFGHTLTGFKAHYLTNLLRNQIGVRSSTAEAMTQAVINRDPQFLASLPDKLDQLNIRGARRRMVLATVARMTGGGAGVASQDVVGGQ